MNLRRGLTIRQLFEILLVLGLFAMAARGVADPDFWWHLRTGQQIIATHTVPHADLFSHTKYGAPWVAHEWLSEVIIYAVFRAASYAGLIISFAVCIAGAFWITYRRCKGRPYVAGIATIWGAIATIPFWGVRPQMFSLLLTSVFLYLLDRFDRTGEPACLWWMPPLMAVWVNLHGAFAVGLALIAAAIVCKLLDVVINKPECGSAVKAVRALTPVLLASLIAVVINPNGYRMYVYPFETLGSPSIQAYIMEWASPNFHKPEMQAFALLLIAAFAVIAISGKRPATRDFVLLILTAYASLRSSRHVPLFTLLAVPVLAAGLESILVERRWLEGLRQANPRPPRIALNYSIALLLVVLCVLRTYSVVKKQPALEAREYPKAAVEFVQRQHSPGPIFNSYEWGGYLIWTLYPEYRVYADGRCDMYGDRFLEEFVHTYRAENDWRTVLRRTDVRTAILPPEAPLAVALKDDPEWNVAFQDRLSVVIVRKGQDTVSAR